MLRPLKIVVIGAGTSCHVQDRIRWFVNRGHEIHLLSLEPSGVSGIHEIQLENFGLRKLRSLQLVWSLWRSVKEIKPDIIHVHYASGTAAWAATVIEFHPLVVSVMGGDILFEEQGSTTPFGRSLTRSLLESADWITAKSNYLIQALKNLGEFDAKATRILWGIDPDVFRRLDPSPLRRRLGIPDRSAVILSSRLLQPLYNIHLIIESMPEVLRTCPGAKLLITESAADQRYKERLEDLCKRLDVGDAVRFVGAVPHAEMPLYYSLADIAIGMPSSDGLPQSVFEAMACGTPNVVANLERYHEILEPRKNVLFADWAAPSIAKGIGELLTDSEFRRRIIEDGERTVRLMAAMDQEAAKVEKRFVELIESIPTKTPRISLHPLRFLWIALHHFSRHFHRVTAAPPLANR